MKSVIIYYSHRGHTKKVTELLFEYLKEKSDVEIIELKALDETDNVIREAYRAFMHKKAKLQPVNFDLTTYDLVCLGTPVWAAAPTPAMNTYLDRCSGLEGKTVILFATGHRTYEVCPKFCIKYMQDVLSKKGVKDFRIFYIRQVEVKDREFVLSQIKKAICL